MRSRNRCDTHAASMASGNINVAAISISEFVIACAPVIMRAWSIAS